MYIHPSVASAPTNLQVVQQGATSVTVSWGPPSPLGYTNGYRISAIAGGDSNIYSVDGGSTNYTLTGLQGGVNYTISIIATSEHLPSESISISTSGKRKYGYA